MIWFMALPEPCLLFLIIFSMKKWNFSGRALSQEKRKDHAEWNEYKKYVTEKRIYIMSIQEQTARSYGRYGCAPDFRSWKTRRNPERHWHCHFVRDSFGSYRQVVGGQTGRQYGRLYQTDSENQEKYNICFCIIFPKKRKWTIPDSQYLWVADRNAHEHSCPWTNKNIGNLKMMAENRTCLVASRRNKKKRQDYFESSSFSTNPIGIHSKLPCHFFLISIQYIYPSNT